MKKEIIVILCLITSSFVATAQTFSLEELQNLCKSQKWETVDNTLSNKGWKYDNSEGGDYEISTISYAYDRTGSDRAISWIYLGVYKNRVECIGYQPTEGTFKSIKASLSANGYKQIDNSIDDGAIFTTYTNSGFILNIKIYTEKLPYGGGTQTSYLLEVARKGSVFDEYNGEKIEYYEGTLIIKSRHTLKNGALNGKYTLYYSNGKIGESGTMVNGKEDGLVTIYADEGWTFSEYYYKEGVPNGKYTIYHSNGKIKESGTYVDGEKDSLVTIYDEEGWKAEEVYFKEGVENGTYTYYHSNGKIKESGTFVDGQRDGFVTGFDNEGRKSAEVYFKEGIANGKYIYYYSNGKIKESGTFVNWERDGFVTDYDIEGRKILQAQFKNGKKDGLWEEFWGTGNKMLSLNYEDDILNGAQKLYDKNEKLAELDVYSNGLLIRHQIFTEEGDTIFEFKLIHKECSNGFLGEETDNLHRTVTQFCYNVSIDSFSKKPLFHHFDSLPKNKHGRYIEYDLLFRKTMEGEYSSGEKVGKWIYYLPDQKVYYEEYADYSAPVRFYNDDGSPYTGNVMFQDSQTEKYKITKKIKKSLIQEVIYTDIQTRKVIKKEKYKDGILESDKKR